MSTCLIAVWSDSPAEAQTRRYDVAMHVAGVRAISTDGNVISPGAGLSFDVNLSERFGVEARASWFPRQEITTDSQGGRMWHAAVGASGRLWQSPRFAVDGLLLPGLLRFSNTATEFRTFTVVLPDGPHEVVGRAPGPATRFVLGLGGRLEFRPARGWSTRLEYLYQLVATPGDEYRFPPSPGGGTLVLVIPATTNARWQVSAGLAYQTGSAVRDLPSGPVSPWQVGLHTGYGVSVAALGGGDLISGGDVGGFGSYRLSRFMHADVSVSMRLNRQRLTSPYEGGRVAVGLAGVRLGVDSGRFGMFVKVRGGTVSHSRVLRSVFPHEPRLYGRVSHPALDVGGVLEMRLSSRLALRAELGNLMTFLRDELLQRAQTGLGIGWRF